MRVTVRVEGEIAEEVMICLTYGEALKAALHTLQCLEEDPTLECRRFVEIHDGSDLRFSAHVRHQP